MHGATAILECSGGQRVSYEITRPQGYLAVQGLRPVNLSGHRHYSVSLRISGQQNPNAAAFAIRSFIVIPETDVSARAKYSRKAVCCVKCPVSCPDRTKMFHVKRFGTIDDLGKYTFTTRDEVRR